MKNDDKILELKELLAKKKEEAGPLKRFNSITNCILNIDGGCFNINALPIDQLYLLLIKLNAYRLSAIDLNLNTYEKCMFSGYDIHSWIDDVKQKIDVLNQKEDNVKIKALEKRLSTMLSDEKKTEIEIDEIADILKRY